MSRTIGGFLAGALAAFWLALAPAQAASPDPVAFGVAVERGDRRQVEKWLDEGMPPDYQADRIGTGLMIAAWNGDIPMMELFVGRGANPRRANRNGEQALQLAAWNGHAAAVRWLLEHGAVLNRDDKNWGALHYAVFNGHLELARELIARGADVNARSPNGSTPLMMAAREGRDEIARLLLESGADTALKSDWGDTALSFAMRYAHYKLGQMIASPEEFEIAVKAPKESFGEPVRSVAAPSQIEELLRQIREANASGAETVELRRKLHAAIAEFRGPPKPQGLAGPKVIKAAPPPKALVITAKRAQPKGGERVEVVPADGGKAVPGTVKVTPAQPAVSPSRIADILRQIRVAEAQGQPTEALRRELDEAMAKLK
ncbi:ankyrin repeat domain-containing protein [Azospira restricta]|uniref:Ankyrin repeat domain-containing protein n=1 Tax=Azospira restricta TaxID=404405 RepID=A0A974SQQ9_9RHOO|nr:ankyrin repeat domain-containing protein [Azospira restricta]QRJ64674.1 ankyrin repeat domain-containing protein [Azospira restricta]